MEKRNDQAGGRGSPNARSSGSFDPVEFSNVHPDIYSRLDELGLLDDPDFISEALVAFAEDGDRTIEQLAKAIDNGDASSCEQLSHRMKGASLNIGAEKLGGLTLMLEEMGRKEDISGAGPLYEQIREEFASVRDFALRLSRRSKAA